MVSENENMIGECDLLIKSINFFSNKNTEIYFSIVLQGNETKLPSKPNTIKKIETNECKKLFNCNITNYLKRKCEFYFCPQVWNLGMPCRWFVKPKSKTCIMIDVDMVACNNLDLLYSMYNSEEIHGVKARKNKEIISKKDWEKIGFSEEDINNYYINFGLVVVPSIHLEKIGFELFENYKNMSKLHGYFAGQLALAYSIKKLKLKLNLLPSKFNYYDLDEFPGREEILILHLLENKGAYKENVTKNKYIKLVQDIKKEIKNFYLL